MGIHPIRILCRKIIPLVYDESLSYYEVLCKVKQKLNEVIDFANEQLSDEHIDQIIFEELQMINVSAETLASDEPASVEATVEDETINLKFGIPAGEKGEDGQSIYAYNDDITVDTVIAYKSFIPHASEVEPKANDYLVGSNGGIAIIDNAENGVYDISYLFSIGGDGRDGADGYSVYFCNQAITLETANISKGTLLPSDLTKQAKIGDSIIGNNGGLVQITTNSSQSEYYGVTWRTSIKGATGAQGVQGIQGVRGYGLYCCITNNSLSEETWVSTVTIGRELNWLNTSSIRGDCKTNDFFFVIGTSTDIGNTHVIFSKCTNDIGYLSGIVLAHTTIPKGIDGSDGTDGEDGVNGSSVYYSTASINYSTTTTTIPKNTVTIPSGHGLQAGDLIIGSNGGVAKFITETPQFDYLQIQYVTSIKGADGEDGKSIYSYLEPIDISTTVAYRVLIAHADTLVPKLYDILVGSDGGVAIISAIPSPGTYTISYLYSIKGAQGAQGVAGQDGEDGEDGYSVYFCNQAITLDTHLIAKGSLTPSDLTKQAKVGDSIIGNNGGLVQITSNSSQSEYYGVDWKTSIKGATGAQGIQGIQGIQGVRGYGLYACVTRNNLTEANWTYYGAIDRETTWTDTWSIRGDCKANDFLFVAGTATDTGNAHILFSKCTSNTGDLIGINLGHIIIPKGAQGEPRDIIDTLTSTRTDAALSANQGRVLKSQIPTNYVPNSRTVNNKALSSDIILYGNDIKADNDSTSPTLTSWIQSVYSLTPHNEETWTFTLDNGTTVTKKVALWS